MNFKTCFLTVITLLLSTSIFAQKEIGIKEKLEKINGTVNKIVITTDKEDFVFEGDEAKVLLKKLKSKKQLKWISEDGEDVSFGDDDVIVFKSKNGKKHLMKHKRKGHKMMMIMDDDDDMDIIDGKKTIKVEVENENGEKEITVTTKENGKEKVETYKGKKADEYLEKMKDDDNIHIYIDEDSDGENVWLSKEDMDGDNIEKQIKVSVDDGKKIVTVTTTKDGKESVKTYEGEEAEKFLNDMDSENNVKVEEKIINGKKFKKIIIKEIEDEDEK